MKRVPSNAFDATSLGCTVMRELQTGARHYKRPSVMSLNAAVVKKVLFRHALQLRLIHRTATSGNWADLCTKSAGVLATQPALGCERG